MGPRKFTFLPYGHLNFESAVTAQNDEFKANFDSSSSRSLNVMTQPRNSILKLCTRKIELALKVKFYLTAQNQNLHRRVAKRYLQVEAALKKTIQLTTAQSPNNVKTTWQELVELAKRWKTWLELGENLSFTIFNPTLANSGQVGGQTTPNSIQVEILARVGWFGSAVWPGPYTAMATDADKLKWRKIRISAVSTYTNLWEYDWLTNATDRTNLNTACQQLNECLRLG